MIILIELLIILFLPAGVLRLISKAPFLKKIGAIAICNICGVLFSLLPIPHDKSFTQLTASVVVAIAIPLVLFGFDLRKVRVLARDMIKGYGLQVAATIVCTFAAALIAGRLGLAHAPQLAGMAAGLYTGSTANMIAVGSALLPGADGAEVIVAANTADLVVGGSYFFIVLLFMCPIYRRFLGKRAVSERDLPDADEIQDLSDGDEYDFASVPKDRRSMTRLGSVILLAVLCLAVGAGLELLISGNLDGSLYIVLTVSVLGIAGSFVRPIRETKGSYQIGQYMVLMFSLGLCMSIDLSVLFGAITQIFLFFAVFQTACVIVHIMLCKLFRLDGGTALITNTAGIFGPPFIAPVAQAYGERQLIAPGIICAVVGLVIGNFLGIGIGRFLSLLPVM